MKMSLLSTTFRNEKSHHGHDLNVLKSALQKYIRRGETAKALYCCDELMSFRYESNSIITNFLHRVHIIMLEDICNISLWERFEHLDLNNVREAVCYLSESNSKARICSHLRTIFNEKYFGLISSFPELTDYKQGIEIVRGERSLEDWKRYMYELLLDKSIFSIFCAFKLHHSDGVLKTGRKSKPYWAIFDVLSNFLETEREKKIYRMGLSWFEELKNVKESFLGWMVPMLYLLNLIPWGSYSEINNVDKLVSDEFKFDSYVYDIHTGNKSETPNTDFAEIGAVINNEADWSWIGLKKFYHRSKQFEDGMVHEFDEKKNVISNNSYSEADRYQFMIRAQLVTSKFKTDTYYAYDLNDNFVLVKGPMNHTAAKRVLEIASDKQRKGLPFVPVKIEMMIPNRWEQTPLGYRNQIDKTIAHPFCIFESLFQPNELSMEVKSSKLWPETEVSISPYYGKVNNFQELNHSQIKSYIEAILYRYDMGIGDLADRNFIVKNDIVYSIDEDAAPKTVDLESELKKNKFGWMLKWIEEYGHELRLDFLQNKPDFLA